LPLGGCCAKPAVQGDSDREFVGSANIRTRFETSRLPFRVRDTSANADRQSHSRRKDRHWQVAYGTGRTSTPIFSGPLQPRTPEPSDGSTSAKVAIANSVGAAAQLHSHPWKGRTSEENRGGDAGFIAAPCKVCPFPTHLHHPTGQRAFAHMSRSELRGGRSAGPMQLCDRSAYSNHRRVWRRRFN
jgi:hypothetical protein